MWRFLMDACSIESWFRGLVLVVSEVSVWRYGAECEKRGWVSQSNISRRVAGSWFISSVWYFWFI